MADTDWHAIRAKFAEPFEDTQYRVGSTSKRKEGGKYPAGTRGQLLAYIDARQVADRLDDTVGPENWTDLYRTVDAAAKAIECTLTVCGVTKVDVGYPNSANDGDDKEPLKAAYSDALKRAAVKFGIGRYLYDLDAAWVDIDEWGKPLRTPQSRPAAPAARPQPMPQAAAVPPKQAVDDDPLITDTNAPAAVEYGRLAQRAADIGIPFEMLTLPLHRSKIAAQYRALKARVDAKAGATA